MICRHRATLQSSTAVWFVRMVLPSADHHPWDSSGDDRWSGGGHGVCSGTIFVHEKTRSCLDRSKSIQRPVGAVERSTHHETNLRVVGWLVRL